MKVGIGLYRRMLNSTNFQFARQIGCTHIVAHMVDYFKEGKVHGSDGTRHWGPAGDPNKLWEADELIALRKQVHEHGLELEAIENLDPAHWHDILLDGPKRDQQLENIKQMIRAMGQAGIKILGYNFSIAGVWAHQELPCARGGAYAVGFDDPQDQPRIPNGQVWNMLYDNQAGAGEVAPFSHDELWQRLQVFLEALIPVAEESGVKLAAHPDDPPMPTLRETPRLVYQPHMYDRLLELVPSEANRLEFCLGTIQEMSEGNVYEATEHYSAKNAIGYVHCRNVKGKVPSYREVFVDEGDIDVLRIMSILKKNNFQGVIIPDHTPQLSCDAPWHSGMAHAVGYIKAAIEMVNRGLVTAADFE